MFNSFYTPDLTDKRIIYSADYLVKKGYKKTNSEDNADFILLGVNPNKELLKSVKPIFAGNIMGSNIFDYTRSEEFAIENAYLTAEAALALAINESRKSLINSSILIIGFGRIGKALRRYLAPFSRDITVCQRNSESITLAENLCTENISFDKLKVKNSFDYIFNTVPHPVMGENELEAVKDSALIIDLASFPGGVDKHYAKHKGIKLIEARGLPAAYSPESAGIVVGKTVEKMIREGIA